MKTVFFGPFIGEFGWECSHWHAWVRRMCREKFSGYKKIAASYPGREPYYPEVDEFWSHPEDFTRLRISHQSYFSDFWLGKWPPPQGASSDAIASTDFTVNVSEHVDQLLESYRARLPKDTVWFVPHKLNVSQKFSSPGTLIFGLSVQKHPKPAVRYFPLPFEEQKFESLRPSAVGERLFNDLNPSRQRIIAVYPRYRPLRRADKNWPREKYDQLIRELQSKHPQHKIALLGEIPGSYYGDGVPVGCLDLINIEAHHRMDLQVAALKQADLALGSLSGALLVALLSGCPVVDWGPENAERRTRENNFLNTPLVYIRDTDPSVETIARLSGAVLSNSWAELAPWLGEKTATAAGDSDSEPEGGLDLIRRPLKKAMSQIRPFEHLPLKIKFQLNLLQEGCVSWQKS